MTGCKLQGFSELIKKMRTFDDRLEFRIRLKALTRGAQVIAGRARELAPKRKGFLAKSVGVVRYKALEKARSMAAVAVTSRRGKRFRGWYAHIVELGYGLQRPQPFIRPAFEEKKDEALREVRDELKANLEKAGLR